MSHTPRNIVKASFEDARRDVHRMITQRRYWGFGTLSFAWIATLVGFLTALCLFADGRLSQVDSRGKACVLGGIFSLVPGSYTPWSTDGFFQINLSFGRMSFGEAKAVDIAWDIVVGRGGQAVLAYVSWRAFAAYLPTSMEKKPVTYNTFRNIFFESSPSIDSVARLIRDFISRKSLHSKIAMAFMVANMMFTLAFATLASAMTGYTTYVTANIEVEGDSIPFEKFGLLLYTIHDGGRIGLENETRVTFQESEKDPVFEYYEGRSKSQGGSVVLASYIQRSGRLSDNVLSDERLSYWLAFASLRDLQESLEPALNITVRLPQIPVQNQNITWLYNKHVYDQDYLEQRGTCQPTQEYAWGFSFTQLFIVTALLTLWSLGTVSLFIRTEYTKRVHDRTSVVGPYKAVIHLSKAMTRELHLDRQLAKKERDLKKYVSEARGGSIAFSAPKLVKFQFKTELQVWLRRRKWWLLAFFSIITLIVGLLECPIRYHASRVEYDGRTYLWLSCFGPLLGVLLAMLACSTAGSRFMFTLITTLLCLLASTCIFLVPETDREVLQYTIFLNRGSKV